MPNSVKGDSPVATAETSVGYISDPATHKARNGLTLNFLAAETDSKNGRK